MTTSFGLPEGLRPDERLQRFWNIQLVCLLIVEMLEETGDCPLNRHQRSVEHVGVAGGRPLSKTSLQQS